MAERTSTRAAGAAKSGSGDAETTQDDAALAAARAEEEAAAALVTEQQVAEDNAAADAAKASRSSKPDDEQRYGHDYFVVNAVVLLQSDSATVAGAMTKAERKTLTLGEAKALVKDHSERPVEFAGQEEQE